MNLVLRRDPVVPAHVTFGVMEGAGGPYQTLELPFRPTPMIAEVVIPPPGVGARIVVSQPGGSARNSCVPEGIYNLVRHSTEKHPFTWALVNETLGVYHLPGEVDPNMPGARSTILLHPGNTALDTEGCILVGSERSHLFTTPGVVDSVRAFNQLKAHLPWVEGHTLTILGKGAIPS